jgi:hypothetical protein
MDAFCQVRTWKRAWRLGVTQLLCLGRHTVTNLLCTAGRQNIDWSADYRLFSEDHWEPQRLFAVVMDSVLERLPAGCPLVLAMDDTHVSKTGTHVPGASYRRDPLSPKFHCNLIRAQRFLQVSAALYATTGPGPARCIPVAFEHAPSVPHPKKSDPPERWQEYRQRRKQDNLSTRGLALIKRLCGEMDRSPQGAGHRLVMGVDASYTNRTVLRGLPPGVVLIGRTRKDLALFALPEAGIRGRYGRPLPTPEQLRQDDSVPWRTVPAYAAGKMHEFRVKTMGPALWKKAGMDRPVRIMVVAPVGYRLRRGSKLLYRQPALLLCTDVQMPDAELLQYYLWRWGVEVNHRDEKQIIGVGQAQVTNEQSAQRQPALAVFSYATLLLAAADTWGVDAIEGPLPPPKWRAKSSGRLTTQQMVQELRNEVWAKALDHLADGAEGFATIQHDDTKPLELSDNLRTAVLYGSAA